MDIALIGFGGVGKAFLELVEDKKKYLKEKYYLHINIKYIIKSDGGLYCKEGLDLEALIEYFKAKNVIQNHSLWQDNMNIDYVIKNKDVDTLVELTTTNIIDGQPALQHMYKALDNGINVVTGNKGPIVLDYKNLKEKADKNKVKLMLGCTTGGALPSITGGTYDLAGAEILSIEGVLNGTSNFILTEMLEKEIEYKEALKVAQAMGIAEANPKLDVEGYDTAIKIIILSNILMGTNIKLEQIKVEGITNLKSEELIELKEESKKVKLIGKVEKENDKILVAVRPTVIDLNHPLYSVDGKNKGVYYKTDTLGDISIIGGASGTVNAAAAILRDIILIGSLE